MLQKKIKLKKLKNYLKYVKLTKNNKIRNINKNYNSDIVNNYNYYYKLKP